MSGRIIKALGALVKSAYFNPDYPPTADELEERKELAHGARLEFDGLHADVERLKNDRPALWECPSCAFGFDARHTDTDDSHSCPVCAETILRAEVARLRELRQRGCECSDEEACAFLRERDTARAEVERLTKERDDLQRWYADECQRTHLLASDAWCYARARDTALRDLAQAREYITALSADCKRLEEDREYNAGLVTQARERVRVLEEALKRVGILLDGYPEEENVLDNDDVLKLVRAALSANPGDDDKRGAR